MKKRWIFATLAVVAVAGSWAVLGSRGETHAQAAAGGPPEVTVAQVLVRAVNDSNEFTGRLQAVDTIQLRPRVSGYVDSVHFTEGALVKKGQLLFRIDPRPYQAEVDRLQANLSQARSELTLADANAARGQRLLEQHAISREEGDRLSTAAQSAKAQLASTGAALDAAKLNLGFTEVRAPVDGRVSNALITPGNLVTSNDVLTSVVSVNPVYAYFDVDEHSYLKLEQLRRERGVAPKVAMALSNEEGFPHAGRIDFVDNQLRAGSGTIRLRAVFDNADGSYTPGLYVRVQLRSDSQRPRALIDDRAVASDLGNKYVLVLKDRKVEYRRVVTGPLLDGLRVVDEGLNKDDVVVVNGLQHVRPGAEVNATKVAMETRSLDPDKQLALGGGSTNKVAAQH
ncbi:efflux RND transporter periplasmic adaptor subunit [Dyella sp. LX-66]|uniref:efflux RND transporter periplasmic adaptor subunit n=1 Tax=unclassified Dyella TaxID=2634549 RepID=UPI001BE0610B|nr:MULTISPECIES: efflux RND transporter periplasmic adaptor subunit [unclassified Dyella]MBT2119281.1 efflux RND transporter periplasmic adaptor subunit [Dyella sp. LX-1]MBT2141652.1 efflux RND transporter periplasmic adaptor subunit [Dyella sp. LX-66]